MKIRNNQLNQAVKNVIKNVNGYLAKIFLKFFNFTNIILNYWKLITIIFCILSVHVYPSRYSFIETIWKQIHNEEQI